MLEFIVLGQIPGTHLQITLSWFVFTLFGLIAWYDLRVHASGVPVPTNSSRPKASHFRHTNEALLRYIVALDRWLIQVVR